MALQKVFKEAYVETLRCNIDPFKYAGATFDYDETQVKYIANVHHPEGLQERLDPTDLLGSAIALYEAYRGLTPLAASKDELWTYLSHVDLYGFMQRWYPEVTTGAADAKFIQNRWFRNPDGVMRSSLPGLWWAVHCTVDESREDSYELTRLLFRNNNIRTRYLGASTIIRHREAVQGILEFLLENPDVSDVHFVSRSMFITQYFNRLGATKQLAYLGKEFFKDELMKIKPNLLTITSKEQIFDNKSKSASPL